MLQVAFKEWAVICTALAQGKQALILRKGGIAEELGGFQIEQPRFWLFPTYTHQQTTGISAEAAPLLAEVEQAIPPADVVRLSHWAEVTSVFHLHDELPALLLGHLHFWSDATVRQRFAYRTPGLYVLMVRVYRAPQVFELQNVPAYEGCKSWVHLKRALPTEGSEPALSEQRYADLRQQIDLLLAPKALV